MLSSVVRLCLTAALVGQSESHLQVIQNPHITGAQTCETSCSAQALDVTTVIQTTLPVQPDTFHSITPVKYLGVTVPVYRFQQPARLSSKELPFSIINVASIGWEDDVRVISVPHEKAIDSWYVGYKWDVLVCTTCEEMKHLGWRFSSLDGQNSFYSLIVTHGTDVEGISISLFGDAIALGEGLFDTLSFGVPAPAWMLALVSTSTVVQ